MYLRRSVGAHGRWGKCNSDLVYRRVDYCIYLDSRRRGLIGRRAGFHRRTGVPTIARASWGGDIFPDGIRPLPAKIITQVGFEVGACVSAHRYVSSPRSNVSGRVGTRYSGVEVCLKDTVMRAFDVECLVPCP